VSQQILPLAIALALSLAACSKDQPPPAAEAKAEPSEEKKPAVDPKIASAMAAAEKSARSESGAPSGQGAPPPDGILGGEAAARELAPGSPAALVLGGDGSAPKLRLGRERITPGTGPAGKLAISYRSGGSVMPTIEFDLKPKITTAGGETQPASAPAGSAPGNAGAGQLALRFALAGARPASNQPGRLPENARAEIAKLNGSYVELVAEPSGALVAQSQKLAGDNPDLEPLIMGSTEALSAVLLPYPEVPVGVGAFWMVKSRETINGAAVIAYRMVKLTELSPTQAKLSVNTRRYLIEPNLPMAGLPPHQVRRFESEGESTLSVKPGSIYPDKAESHDGFMALVTPNERPNQQLPVRTELSANVSFQR
jgi:hypothetical protein